MHISTLLIIFAVLLSVIMFFPEIFPKCSCCRRIKFRAFFKIHNSIKISPGYSGNKSVCKKCCSRYDIGSLKEYELVDRIRKRVEMEMHKSSHKH